MTAPAKLNLSNRVLFMAGPCRGYPDANKALFELAEQKVAEAIKAAGFAGEDADNFSVTVVHTHQDGIFQHGSSKNLVAAFQMSDATVMLPGWARKGATVEDLMATIAYGKPVFFFDPADMTFVLMSPENVTLKPQTDIFEGSAE